MLKIKKGDTVIVMTGKDRTKVGEVVKVYPKLDKVVVRGVNFKVKAIKRNPEAGVEGGFASNEAPIHVSNVAIYNVETKKADKIGFKFLEDGKKVRYYKSNGQIVGAGV